MFANATKMLNIFRMMENNKKTTATTKRQRQIDWRGARAGVKRVFIRCFARTHVFINILHLHFVELLWRHSAAQRRRRRCRRWARKIHAQLGCTIENEMHNKAHEKLQNSSHRTRCSCFFFPSLYVYFLVKYNGMNANVVAVDVVVVVATAAICRCFFALILDGCLALSPTNRSVNLFHCLPLKYALWSGIICNCCLQLCRFECDYCPRQNEYKWGPDQVLMLFLLLLRLRLLLINTTNNAYQKALNSIPISELGSIAYTYRSNLSVFHYNFVLGMNLEFCNKKHNNRIHLFRSVAFAHSNGSASSWSLASNARKEQLFGVNSAIDYSSVIVCWIEATSSGTNNGKIRLVFAAARWKYPCKNGHEVNVLQNDSDDDDGKKSI